MSVTEKAIALLGFLTPQDVRAMPPAQRRNFRDLCLALARVADEQPPKVGVLADLRDGQRAQ